MRSQQGEKLLGPRSWTHWSEPAKRLILKKWKKLFKTCLTSRYKESKYIATSSATGGGLSAQASFESNCKYDRLQFY